MNMAVKKAAVKAPAVKAEGLEAWASRMIGEVKAQQAAHSDSPGVRTVLEGALQAMRAVLAESKGK